MEKIDWKKKYEELEKKYKADLDSEKHFQNMILRTAQKWSIAFDVLMGTDKINNADLKELFCELYELRDYKKRLEGQEKYKKWKELNPEKGFTEYLFELGPFKEVDVDLTP